MFAVSIHDHLPSRIERTLIALLRQANEYLIGRRAVVILDLCVSDSRGLDSSTDLRDIRRLREFHLDFGAAAKVDAARYRTAPTTDWMRPVCALAANALDSA